MSNTIRIVSKDEALEMIKALQKYYKTTDGEVIELRNELKEEQLRNWKPGDPL